MASVSIASQANLDTNSLLSAFVFAERMINLKIRDRASVRPLIPVVGNISGAGSDSYRVRRAGLGASLAMSATAGETTDVSASSFDIEGTTLAAARHALVIENTFFAQVVDDANFWNPVAIANTMLESWDAGFMADLATAGAAFSTALGSNTADLDVDTFFDVIEDFEENSVDGAIKICLHSRGLGQLRRSITQEGGVLAHREDSMDFMSRKELGYAGDYMGVQIFMSNRVTESTGKQNFAWTDGALGQVIGTVENITTLNGIARPAGTPMIIGLQEDHTTNRQEVAANAYFGVGIIYDARGRLVRCNA